MRSLAESKRLTVDIDLTTRVNESKGLRKWHVFCNNVSMQKAIAKRECDHAAEIVAREHAGHSQLDQHFLNPKKYRSVHRVLLVEDFEPLAEATAEFIREEGLDVRIASSGHEALKLAPTFQPEIVLCDMRLPDMSGYEVAQALRDVPGVKDAVIAMHTAMDETNLQMLNQGMNSVVDQYLSKPITSEKLDALVLELESQTRKKSSDIGDRRFLGTLD
jgi:CheY-like chemotaxis protein